MVMAINSKEKSKYWLSLRRAMMQSVPGAIATGSRFTVRSSLVSQYPVAIAPGTDLILKLGHYLEAGVGSPTVREGKERQLSS